MFNQLIVVPEGITLKQVYAVLRRQGRALVCDFQDLENEIKPSDPKLRTSGFVAAIADFEVEEKFLAPPLGDVIGHEHLYPMTLLQRLIFEAFIFWRNGSSRLDRHSCTLCTGSLCREGYFPVVSGMGGEEDDRIMISWRPPVSIQPADIKRMVKI